MILEFCDSLLAVLWCCRKGKIGIPAAPLHGLVCWEIPLKEAVGKHCPELSSLLCSQSLCSADFWKELLDFGKSLISCAKAPSHGSCVEEAMLHGSCWRQALPILDNCGKKERREYCSWKLEFSLGVLCCPVRSTGELRNEREMGRGWISSH